MIHDLKHTILGSRQMSFGHLLPTSGVVPRASDSRSGVRGPFVLLMCTGIWSALLARPGLGFVSQSLGRKGSSRISAWIKDNDTQISHARHPPESLAFPVCHLSWCRLPRAAWKPLAPCKEISVYNAVLYIRQVVREVLIYVYTYHMGSSFYYPQNTVCMYTVQWNYNCILSIRKGRRG